MVQNLMNDHDSIIRNLRADVRECDNTYNDMGTSDFLTGLMEQHEKQSWMLRATLTAM
jgi:starvation-inducible DNA-binding protein